MQPSYQHNAKCSLAQAQDVVPYYIKPSLYTKSHRCNSCCTLYGSMLTSSHHSQHDAKTPKHRPYQHQHLMLQVGNEVGV
jgi:hypothetical protein